MLFTEWHKLVGCPGSIRASDYTEWKCFPCCAFLGLGVGCLWGACRFGSVLYSGIVYCYTECKCCVCLMHGAGLRHSCSAGLSHSCGYGTVITHVRSIAGLVSCLCVTKDNSRTKHGTKPASTHKHPKGKQHPNPAKHNEESTQARDESS
jgi:hypothetical protein